MQPRWVTHADRQRSRSICLVMAIAPLPVPAPGAAAGGASALSRSAARAAASPALSAMAPRRNSHRLTVCSFLPIHTLVFMGFPPAETVPETTPNCRLVRPIAEDSSHIDKGCRSAVRQRPAAIPAWGPKRTR